MSEATRAGRPPRAGVAATKRVEFVVTPDERTALARVAAHNRQPLATIIRSAVNEFVADYGERHPLALRRRQKSPR